MARIIRGVYSEYPDKVFDHNWHFKCRLTDVLNKGDEIQRKGGTAEIFSKFIEDGKYVIIDYGGGPALDYFTSRRSKEPNLDWRVYEIPEALECYREGLKKYKDLSFHETEYELNLEEGKKYVLNCRGTLQYIRDPIKFLKKNISKFDAVFLREIIVGTDNFLTEQIDVEIINVVTKEDLLNVFGDDFEVTFEEGGEPYESWEDIGDRKITEIRYLLAIRK